MRILHVLAQLPGSTGSGIYYRNLIDRMERLEVEQAALYAVQGTDHFDRLPPERRFAVGFQTAALPFPVAGMSDVMPYESTVYSQMDEGMIASWSAAFRRELERAKHTFQPQVVILHHLWMLTSLAVEIFPQAVKIGICHNTDLRQAAQNPAMKARYVTNIPRLDAVFSLSDAQWDPIVSVYGCDSSKITTVGGGYDEKRFYPQTPKEYADKARIVFAGKIHRSKGVLELVRAFRKLKRTRPDIQLDIIGTANEEYARLLEEATGDDPDIRRLPAMPQEELAAYIRRRDIFAMPSFYEGLGLIAIEALASGLWTVATKIEGLQSQLGHEIGESGAIAYVGLPRLYDTDKPVEEDLDAFVDRLTDQLALQVERVMRREPFPAVVPTMLERCSWAGVAQSIYHRICEGMQ